jgi:hypothetical protein
LGGKKVSFLSFFPLSRAFFSRERRKLRERSREPESCDDESSAEAEKCKLNP